MTKPGWTNEPAIGVALIKLAELMARASRVRTEQHAKHLTAVLTLARKDVPE